MHPSDFCSSPKDRLLYPRVGEACLLLDKTSFLWVLFLLSSNSDSQACTSPTETLNLYTEMGMMGVAATGCYRSAIPTETDADWACVMEREKARGWEHRQAAPGQHWASGEQLQNPTA